MIREDTSQVKELKYIEHSRHILANRDVNAGITDYPTKWSIANKMHPFMKQPRGLLIQVDIACKWEDSQTKLQFGFRNDPIYTLNFWTPGHGTTGRDGYVTQRNTCKFNWDAMHRNEV